MHLEAKLTLNGHVDELLHPLQIEFGDHNGQTRTNNDEFVHWEDSFMGAWVATLKELNTNEEDCIEGEDVESMEEHGYGALRFDGIPKTEYLIGPERQSIIV